MIAISDTWNCPNCEETSEIQFKRCWNCGADRDGVLDPYFSIDSRPQSKTETRVSWAMGFAWLMAWIGVCTLVIAAAVILESSLPSFWIVRLSLAAALLLLCLLLAVFINILSRLYLWVRNYVYADQPDEPEPRQVSGGQNQIVQQKGLPGNE